MILGDARPLLPRSGSPVANLGFPNNKNKKVESTIIMTIITTITLVRVILNNRHQPQTWNFEALLNETPRKEPFLKRGIAFEKNGMGRKTTTLNHRLRSSQPCACRNTCRVTSDYSPCSWFFHASHTVLVYNCTHADGDLSADSYADNMFRSTCKYSCILQARAAFPNLCYTALLQDQFRLEP